LEEA
jgi:hypothetical protein